MSLLAPLYIAGFLAIAAPIIFHLIRRTPTGRQTFSSLMFLDPSPPRITKRSRLNNILLLLLRAAALALLAIAFARPFFKQQATADVSRTQGKRVALLVDTSASMQRGGAWENARAEVENTLRELSPNDEVGLFFFDRDVRSAMTFREWNELDGSRRGAMLRARLSEASPTWGGTDLAGALSTVADLLNETEGQQPAADTMDRRIVLVSDLQRGSKFEALQGYEWPKNVTLQVKPVAPQQPGNANVQLVEEREGSPAGADGRLRVRVSNQPGSQREQFTLGWADERGPIAGAAPVKVYVAPGRNQVVRVARPTTAPAAGDRLVLAGDDADFDNTLFVAPAVSDAVRIVYLGNDAADDTKGMLYFLRSAAGDTRQRKVELTPKRTGERVTEAELLGTRLVVVTQPVTDNSAAALRRYAEAGGNVLWVLHEAGASTGLSALMHTDAVKVEEAPASNYVLISRVATDHPLFAPFADARFGDFTKIHFWNHRKVTVANEASTRTLAWFDSGDPFLLEHPIGKGRVLIATAGWHPADSQLALSTKFVPLIDGLLKRPDGAIVEAQYAVHDRIALPPAHTNEKRVMRGPDGRQIELQTGASSFDEADRPGIYRLNYNGRETALAVNLHPDESRTQPLDVVELEQLGVVLAKPSASPAEIAQQRRQLQVVELESRQKLWRWLIVGVLGLLVVETALAGHLAHRAVREQVVTV